jgi:hypothetical protein
MLRPVNESDNCVVEQAKGALMLRYGTGSRESLAVLDRWAQEAGAPVTEVAEALVDGICLGRVTPETDGMVRWLEQRLRGDVSELRGDGETGMEGLAPGEGAVVPTVPAPARPEAGPRQWRYHSAVHAARVLRSR